MCGKTQSKKDIKEIKLCKASRGTSKVYVQTRHDRDHRGGTLNKGKGETVTICVSVSAIDDVNKAKANAKKGSVRTDVCRQSCNLSSVEKS